MANVSFPLEYHAEVLGDYDDQKAAEWRLTLFALAAAVGIFLLLQAAHGSWSFAGMGFLCLLASLVGGVLAAWIDGGNVTLATVAGLLAVLAVALRHQLMLVEPGARPPGRVRRGASPGRSSRRQPRIASMRWSPRWR